jgi:hypothetical protein
MVAHGGSGSGGFGLGGATGVGGAIGGNPGSVGGSAGQSIGSGGSSAGGQPGVAGAAGGTSAMGGNSSVGGSGPVGGSVGTAGASGGSASAGMTGTAGAPAVGGSAGGNPGTGGAGGSVTPGTGGVGGGAVGGSAAGGSGTAGNAGGAGGAGGSSGVVVAVCAQGGDYATIGAAIAAAPAGATLEVCPGTYAERLTIDNKPLRIVGTGGPTVTFLDAGSAGSAVTVTTTGSTGLTLRGLTIQHGTTSGMGAGISCTNSTLVMVDDVLTNHSADGGGGGLMASGCAVDISTCRFDMNRGFPRGGGALLTNSTGEIRDSQFTNGSAEEGAGIATVGGSVALRRNNVAMNAAVLRGGGLYLEGPGAVDANIINMNTAGWTGGGVFVEMAATPFTGNTVSNNMSMNDGGGLYIDQANGITINNNTISGNQSDDDGGGLRIFESAAHVEGNTIQDNRAGDGGGGIRISHVAAMFINNIVRRNQANSGGGVDFDNDSSVWTGGEISANTAATQGGGIQAMLGPWNGALIADVLITGNKATQTGGGIVFEDNYQPVNVQRATITGNTAATGAGITVRTSDFRISNSVVAGNTSTGNGGGIFIGAPHNWNKACPCPPTQATVAMNFVTFYANTAATGVAFYTADHGPLAVSNSILFQNGAQAVTVASGATTPSWSYNDISPALSTGNPAGTNGNIGVDPLFVGAAAGNFHLGAGSPAIDTGDPAVMDRDTTRADMGSTGGPNAAP